MTMKMLHGVVASLMMLSLALNGCYSGGNPYDPNKPTPTPTPVPGATPTPTPGTAQLQITAQTDKIAYNIGEEMSISVQTSKAAYINVFDITPDGVVTRIFPNSYAVNNYLQAGQTCIIPSTNDPFKLKIAGPRGTERVRVVATTDSVNIVPARDFTGDSFAQYNGTVAQFDQAIDEQLARLASGSWGNVNITFQVK